jgi:hypothetical protein
MEKVRKVKALGYATLTVPDHLTGEADKPALEDVLAGGDRGRRTGHIRSDSGSCHLASSQVA